MVLESKELGSLGEVFAALDKFQQEKATFQEKEKQMHLEMQRIMAGKSNFLKSLFVNKKE
jgi:hypothetical protein